ncbi:leucine-rich repeat-containing protein [Tanacetum coccineum]
MLYIPLTTVFMSTQTNEEPQNVPQEEGQRGNSPSISAATGITDLEQKTFTRSVYHFTVRNQTVDSIVERDGAIPYSSPFCILLRLEASTSGSLKKHRDERDNLHAAISTPMVTSRDFVMMTVADLDLADLYHIYSCETSDWIARNGNLSHLSLSHNNCSGEWELNTLLSSLTNLEILDVSYNGFSVTTKNANHYVNPGFRDLGLASCKLKVFPNSFQAMKQLKRIIFTP